MSNAEKMVSEDLIRAILGNAAQGYFSKDHGDQLRVILDQPAQQHQGEPVALPARKPESISFYPTGWNDCLDEIAKLGPLYTHTDPAEVERIRERMLACEEIAENNAKACAEALTKLAEAHALLNRWLDVPRQSGKHLSELAGDTELLLSASAEPSAPKCETCYDASHVPEPMSCKGSLPCPSCAPVEIDERAEFDAWTVSKGRTVGYSGWQYDFGIWKARAALERKQQKTPQ